MAGCSPFLYTTYTTGSTSVQILAISCVIHPAVNHRILAYFWCPLLLAFVLARATGSSNYLRVGHGVIYIPHPSPRRRPSACSASPSKWTSLPWKALPSAPHPPQHASIRSRTSSSTPPSCRPVTATASTRWTGTGLYHACRRGRHPPTLLPLHATDLPWKHSITDWGSGISRLHHRLLHPRRAPEAAMHTHLHTTQHSRRHRHRHRSAATQPAYNRTAFPRRTSWSGSTPKRSGSWWLPLQMGPQQPPIPTPTATVTLPLRQRGRTSLVCARRQTPTRTRRTRHPRNMRNQTAPRQPSRTPAQWTTPSSPTASFSPPTTTTYRRRTSGISMTGSWLWARACRAGPTSRGA